MTNAIAIPTNQAEFETLFGQYSELKHKHETALQKLNKKIAAMQAKHQQENEEDQMRLDQLAQCIQDYAEQHRSELTMNGKTQSVKILSGCLKWRKKHASVCIDGDLSEVLMNLRRRKLSRCIRLKEEINKTALLAERELLERRPIDGISFVDGEESFAIEITR